MYRIARVRLINVHNFVDETIDIERGGHLFLLGDNGSGKSTILDAVQYVLSGGEAFELNAAARLAGTRDEGRTIQGIVLRYDCERGVQNEGGAIAYVALELADDAADRRICVGVGTEATTMEARVVRWGFLAAQPLEAVPLLVAAAEGDAPCPRDELRERLGRGQVFLRMTEYRKAVARRLFGSAELYREVCRFWSMAKAYREIVASSRDFGALFGKLLPAPDSEVFGDILRSLRAVDELEVKLGELDEQRAYVRGLIELAGEVDTQREARARYGWLCCFRERAEAEAALAHNRDRIARGEARIEELEREIRAAQVRLDAARDALDRARAKDRDGLLEASRRAEQSVGERSEERDTCARELGALAARRDACRAALRASLRDLARRLGPMRDDLGDALEAAADESEPLPEAGAFCRSIADAQRRLEEAAGEEDDADMDRERAGAELGAVGDLIHIGSGEQAARAAVRAARQRAVDARRDAERGHERAGREHERLEGRLAALRAQGEELPRVDGFAEVRAGSRTSAMPGVSALSTIARPTASRIDTSRGPRASRPSSRAPSTSSASSSMRRPAGSWISSSWATSRVTSRVRSSACTSCTRTSIDCSSGCDSAPPTIDSRSRRGPSVASWSSWCGASPSSTRRPSSSSAPGWTSTCPSCARPRTAPCPRSSTTGAGLPTACI